MHDNNTKTLLIHIMNSPHREECCPACASAGAESTGVDDFWGGFLHSCDYCFNHFVYQYEDKKWEGPYNVNGTVLCDGTKKTKWDIRDF